MAQVGRKAIDKSLKKVKSFDEKYPIQSYVDGIPIRAVNIVSIYITSENMIRIAKAKKGHRISIAKIIANSASPCGRCKNEPVIIFNEGKYLSIPRGLLTPARTNSGTPKTKAVKKKLK